MFEFSNLTKAALAKAGWFEGRVIDTSPFREYFASQGFFYGEAADTFLSSFGGLVISPMRPPSNTSAIFITADRWS